MNNFKKQIEIIDEQRERLRNDQEKILLDQKKFSQNIAIFLKGKIGDYQIETAYSNPFEYLTLNKDNQKCFYEIFSHTGNIILIKRSPNEQQKTFDTKEKKVWVSFEMFSKDISGICKILDCKKTT